MTANREETILEMLTWMEWRKYQGLASEAKKIHKSILLYEDGYKSAEKEFKKKIRDYYNKYNSWLKEETSSKLARSPNFKRETELRAKVELLKEMIKQWD